MKTIEITKPFTPYVTAQGNAHRALIRHQDTEEYTVEYIDETRAIIIIDSCGRCEEWDNSGGETGEYVFSGGECVTHNWTQADYDLLESAVKAFRATINQTPNIRKMKIYSTYKEAKDHRKEFKKDGKTYSIIPPYHDFIDGVDYGELNPQPILLPAVLDG